MFLMLPTSVLGQNSEFSCIDNTQLNEFAEFTINNNSFSINETINCPHGCSEDFSRCKPAPFTSSFIGFSIIFSLIFMILFIMSRITEATNITFVKLSIILLAFLTLGFVDIFTGTMRLLFGVMSLLTIILIIISASFVTKDKKMRK